MYQRLDIQYLYDGPDVQKGGIMCKVVEPFLLKSAYIRKSCSGGQKNDYVSDTIRGNLYSFITGEQVCEEFHVWSIVLSRAREVGSPVKTTRPTCASRLINFTL